MYTYTHSRRDLLGKEAEHSAYQRMLALQKADTPSEAGWAVFGGRYLRPCSTPGVGTAETQTVCPLAPRPRQHAIEADALGAAQESDGDGRSRSRNRGASSPSRLLLKQEAIRNMEEIMIEVTTSLKAFKKVCEHKSFGDRQSSLSLIKPQPLKCPDLRGVGHIRYRLWTLIWSGGVWGFGWMMFDSAHRQDIGDTDENLLDEDSLVRSIEEFKRGHKASLQALSNSPVATFENALAEVKTSIQAGKAVVTYTEAFVQAASEEVRKLQTLKRKAVAIASRSSRKKASLIFKEFIDGVPDGLIDVVGLGFDDAKGPNFVLVENTILFMVGRGAEACTLFMHSGCFATDFVKVILAALADTIPSATAKIQKFLETAESPGTVIRIRWSPEDCGLVHN